VLGQGCADVECQAVVGPLEGAGAGGGCCSCCLLGFGRFGEQACWHVFELGEEEFGVRGGEGLFPVQAPSRIANRL
jgi:hypothetical protein